MSISSQDYINFKKAIPKKVFKLGDWDCFILVQWIRAYFELPLLPAVDYHQSILEQLNQICQKVKHQKHLCLVSLKNELDEICLGTCLIVEDFQIIIYMSQRVKTCNLPDVKIEGFYTFDEM